MVLHRNKVKLAVRLLTANLLITKCDTNTSDLKKLKGLLLGQKPDLNFLFPTKKVLLI